MFVVVIHLKVSVALRRSISTVMHMSYCTQKFRDALKSTTEGIWFYPLLSFHKTKTTFPLLFLPTQVLRCAAAAVLAVNRNFRAIDSKVKDTNQHQQPSLICSIMSPESHSKWGPGGITHRYARLPETFRQAAVRHIFDGCLNDKQNLNVQTPSGL